MEGTAHMHCSSTSCLHQVYFVDVQSCICTFTIKSRLEMLNSLQGRELTEIINTEHENVTYFPDVDLPPNLVANSDLASVVREADILVFCAPHQFMRGLVSSLQGKVCTSVTSYRAPSL